MSELGFSSIQISELFTILEQYGVFPDVESDAQASKMLVQLLISSARMLDEEQASAFLIELKPT